MDQCTAWYAVQLVMINDNALRVSIYNLLAMHDHYCNVMSAY